MSQNDINSRDDSIGGTSPSNRNRKKNIVEALTSFIKGRPSADDLRQKNIITTNTVSPRIHGYDDYGTSSNTSNNTTNNNNNNKDRGDAKTYGGSSSSGSNNNGSAIKTAWDRIRNLDFTFNKFTFGKTVVHRLNFPQFGLSPSELQSLYPDQQDGIPLVLTKCFEFLKKSYLDTEGLFRVPGSKRDISLLKFRVEDGDLNFDDVNNPYSICGLISTFLKEMPEPLIPLDQYDFATACVKNSGDSEEKKINSLRTLILDLPPANLVLIKKFLEFILLIEEQKSVNKMNSDNLGIIFGPTLMKDPDFTDISKSFVNLKYQSLVVKNLIDHFHAIFNHSKVNKVYRKSMAPQVVLDTSSIDYLDPAFEDTSRRLSNMSSQYGSVPALSLGNGKPQVPPRPPHRSNINRRETIVLSPRVSQTMDRQSQVYAITTLTRPQSRLFNPEITETVEKPIKPSVPARKITNTIKPLPPTMKMPTSNGSSFLKSNSIPFKKPAVVPSNTTTTPTSTLPQKPATLPSPSTTVPPKPLISSTPKQLPSVSPGSNNNINNNNSNSSNEITPNSSPSNSALKLKPAPPKRTFTNCTVVDAEGYQGEAKQISSIDSPSIKPIPKPPTTTTTTTTKLPPQIIPSATITTNTTTGSESPVIKKKVVKIVEPPSFSLNSNNSNNPSTNLITKPFPSKSSPPLLNNTTPKTNSFSNIKEIHSKLTQSNSSSTLPSLSSPPMANLTSQQSNTLTPTSTTVINSSAAPKSKSFLTIKPTIPPLSSHEEPTTTSVSVLTKKYLDPNNKSKSASVLPLMKQVNPIDNESLVPPSSLINKFEKKSGSNGDIKQNISKFQSPDIQKK